MNLNLKKQIKKFLIPGNKLVVFTFHQSSPSYNPQFNSKYIWSEFIFFEQQIKYLRENFQMVSLWEGIQLLNKDKIKGTLISISFDDGDISLKKHIVPFLETNKIPATFFINSTYLSGEIKGYWYNIYNYLINGNKTQQEVVTDEIKAIYTNLRNTRDQEYYQKNYHKIEKLGDFIDESDTFYVDHDFLKNLNSELFTIGLHGHEHQRFSMMPVDWQRNNLQINMDLLFGYPAYKPVFAIPFGKPHDWTNETINLCKELKIEFAFSNGGYNTKKDVGIMRIPVDGLSLQKVMSGMSHRNKSDYFAG
jgi:peptidoglycan/xylan/chitin deacetylase (PgdA/CDA1 family)